MRYWQQSTLQQETESRHLASEPHMRIQVMKIETKTYRELFHGYHGELLIVVWSGTALLETATESQLLNAGDQCLLAGGEPFKVEPEAEGTSIIVQMIWSPGVNPCEECFSSALKFFKT